jgi:putative spermidine/putrescine transport system permease protein
MKKVSLGFRIAVGFTCILLLFLVAPVFVVFPVSITPERYLSLPTTGISFSHYLALWENDVWLRSVASSLVVAGSSTFLALALGVPYSVACWKLGPRWSAILVGIALLPLIVPAIVSGVAFFGAWTQLHLIDSYPGVILADTILSFPFVVIGCSISLAGFDPRIEQAARNLGAGAIRTMILVIVPNILPGILSGGIFAFMSSWEEIVVLLFISSRNVYLLPRALWDGINENVDPSIAAVSSILVVITVLGLLGVGWWSKRRSKPAAIA